MASCNPHKKTIRGHWRTVAHTDMKRYCGASACTHRSVHAADGRGMLSVGYSVHLHPRLDTPTLTCTCVDVCVGALDDDSVVRLARRLDKKISSVSLSRPLSLSLSLSLPV
jgi:hypothetical protein